MVTLIRIVKSGVLNFWRNGWLSTATVFITTLTLITWTGLLLLNVVVTSVLDALSNKVDISVYFDLDASQADMFTLKNQISNLPAVVSVEYISPDEALNIFKKKHGNDNVLIASLQELGQNPLQASLNIKAKTPDDYAGVADFIDKSNLKGIISKVNYSENKDLFQRFSHIIGIIREVGLGLSLVFGFIAFLVAFNTVRLAIYSARDEIGVMKLVGASNAYVHGPFLIEGFLHGLLASVFAILVMLPVSNFISPALAQFIPDINLGSYFSENFLKIFSLQTGAGVFLGIFSSFVATRRYLKV